MLAVMSLSESDLATSAPSIVQSMVPLCSVPIQQVSDQSRKRCASKLEEHRNVKAMKREPQDDKPF